MREGSVIAGRYRLDRILGEGGMGVVWAATHTITGARNALKLVRHGPSPRAEVRERFLREARASTMLDHPNVVPVRDAFELDDGTPVLVMDLLEGETLRSRLAREGRMSIEEAAALMLPVLSAIRAAHAKEIVHRDLKPDNVFLTSKGPLVLDFGIAKMRAEIGSEGTSITASGAFLGTPQYMSPEQATGEKDLDQRCDVWAIGAMLHEMLVGRPLIESQNIGQLVKKLLTADFASTRASRPDLPEDVLSLLDAMLTLDLPKRLDDVGRAIEVLGKHAPHVAATLPVSTESGRRGRVVIEGRVDASAATERHDSDAQAQLLAQARTPAAQAQPADTHAPHEVGTRRSTRARWLLAAAALGVAAAIGVAVTIGGSKSGPTGADALESTPANAPTNDPANAPASTAPTPGPTLGSATTTAAETTTTSPTTTPTPTQSPAPTPTTTPTAKISTATSTLKKPTPPIAASTAAPPAPTASAPPPAPSPTVKPKDPGIVEAPPF